MGYLLKDSPEQALHEAVLNTAAHRRTLEPEVVDLLAQRVGRPQESLSTRELEILRALSTGSSNKELAKQLFISEATVKTHLIHIFQKLGVETRTAAVTVAAPSGILADGLSTACMVLGARRSLALAAGMPGVDLVAIDKKGRRWQSPGLALRPA